MVYLNFIILKEILKVETWENGIKVVNTIKTSL